MAARLQLPQPYAGKITSLRQLAGELSAKIGMLTDVIGDLRCRGPLVIPVVSHTRAG